MELQQKAEQLLGQLIEKATQAGDFVVEQTPLLIQELLTYNLYLSLVQFIGALILMYVLYRVHKFAYLYFEDKDIGDHPEVMLVMLSWFLFAPICVWINLTWLKILVAPRLYLLEYAASLVK